MVSAGEDGDGSAGHVDMVGNFVPMDVQGAAFEFHVKLAPGKVVEHAGDRNGACAVAVACVLNNLTGRELDVELKGGTLHIHWDEISNHVYMTGGAVTVFTGTYHI